METLQRPVSSLSRSLSRVLLVATTLLWAALPAAVSARPPSISEEIEWTWAVRPSHPNPALPNVLLLGDSITRNYFSTVKNELDGTANVYLLATSTSVGDPRLLRQIDEFAKLEGASFRVIHFNNGMHGWGYQESGYQSEFPHFLKAVHKLAIRGATLIWANTTSVKSDNPDGPSNARIDRRNAIAAVLVQQAGIAIDDQHSLMARHEDLYEDSVHFNPAGAAIQGEQAVEMIRSALRGAPGSQ
jgi:hypothetical protein